ncbi:MAG: FAD-dependent oxidoreductase [Treponema sp.]|jgi:fumarate reductase flavoprotein subunit|nr:FAD-dependent oxidoreductase [Treponema sp.]
MKRTVFGILAVAMALALVFSGCASGGSAPAGSSDIPAEERQADIVIVGGGASGMAAALAALEQGGGKVIVIEQQDHIGGTSLLGSEGFFAIESAQQKAAGITTTVADMMDWFTNYTHHLSNAGLTYNWLSQSAGTVDWLAQYGMPSTLMENTQYAHRNQIATYHKYNNKQTGYTAFEENVKKMGGEIILNTKVTDLIQAADGTVTGVVATKPDGGELRVSAKAVILATGGYLANAEMFEEYTGLKPGTYISMTSGTTGEGQIMAIKAGADTYGIHGATYHGAMTFGAPDELMMTPMLWVDGGGDRFCNEELVYDFALWGNIAYSVGGYYWVVVDTTTLQKIVADGSPYTHSFGKTYAVGTNDLDYSVSPATANWPAGFAPNPDIIKTMDELVAANPSVLKAYSIEELAVAMGIPAANLQASIDLYNQAVAAQHDVRFGKDPAYLLYDVSTGPFYALKTMVLAEGSLGGISVNERLEVIRQDRTVISGLYATGSNVGMIYGDSYPSFEGVNMSFAFNSGRMAGYNSATKILGR